MAPRPAAALENATLPTLTTHLATAQRLLETHDHLLVEGAGGLLVELTDNRETLADLALAIPDVGVVIVARSALGTLNHTMLTREALCARRLRCLGVILGSWPSNPSHLEHTNLDHLQGLQKGLLGRIPTGAPGLEPERFRALAPGWLAGLRPQRLGTP